jgi:hypothetical protein
MRFLTVLAITLAVLWPTLPTAYFYLDDFHFAQVAQSHSFFSSLFVPHLDHFLPLYRAQVWLLCHLTGASPWAYNLLSLLSLAFAAHALLRLLSAAGASRAALATFLVAALLWPRWGHWLQGYYCITIYIQNVGLFAHALALVLPSSPFSNPRSQISNAATCPPQPRRRWKPLPLAFTLATLAVLNDISGAWVPAALAAVLLALALFPHPASKASPSNSKFKIQSSKLTIAALAALPLLAFLVDATLVPHRASSAFAGSAPAADLLKPSLFSPQALSYALSLPLDSWSALVLPAWRPSALPWHALSAASLALLFALAAISLSRRRHSHPREVATSAALLAAALLFTILVTLARKNYDGLWQTHLTQHIGSLFLLGTAALVLALDLLLRPHPRAARLLTALPVLLLATTLSHTTHFPVLRVQHDADALAYWGTRTLPDGLHAAARRRAFVADLVALHDRILSFAPPGAPPSYPDIPGAHLDAMEPAMSDANLNAVLAAARFRQPIQLLRTGHEPGWNTGGLIVEDLAAATPDWFHQALQDPHIARFYPHLSDQPQNQ